MKKKYCVVLVTAPSRGEGRKIAKGLLEEKWAACVNVVNQVESFYWWKRKIERAREVLLLVKTMQSKVGGLEKWVRAHHSYTVPEIIVLPVSWGSRPYLDWIGASFR